MIGNPLSDLEVLTFMQVENKGALPFRSFPKKV